MHLDRHELGPGIHAVFTDRRGGVSAAQYAGLNLGGSGTDDPAAVAENRGMVAAAIGLPHDRVVWLRQVHGADVTVAEGPQPADPPAADAAVTTRPGLALAVRVADCTPVVLADPAARVLGAAHAGRPGLAAGVVQAVVARMTELGADPARTVAVVGPAVCGRCYEVPAEMREQVVVAAGVQEAWAETSWHTPAVDVPAGVVAQLAAAGVGSVRRVETCTMESEHLYSYRRDGDTGRFAGYVWMDSR